MAAPAWGGTPGPARSASEATWAVHITLAARWLDPADNEGTHERAVFAPIWENASLRGVGPRVEQPALSLIPAYPYSAPYEDVRLARR